MHSFKNRPGSLVGPGKTGTGDLTGLLSALDRPRQRTGENRANHGPTAGFKKKAIIWFNRFN
jgi:hypothetical protein